MGIKLRRVNKNISEFKKNKISKKWRETGQSVEHFPFESIEIFKTPKRGEYWMNWGIKFEKIRIHTNGRDNQSAKYVFGKEEMLLVNTRCKCVRILTIYKIDNEKKQLLKQFVFEETQFVTVGKIMSISSDSTSSSIDSALTSKQKTVDSTSMTTSCYNETSMKIRSESREVLLDMSTAAFHQNSIKTPQGPATTRYADGLEQYLPKDPVARIEFERSDLDDILIGLLLDNIHTGTSHQQLCQHGNNMDVVPNSMSCQH